ncbi:N-acetylmuramoyl-L-alanine amidase [Desulfatitalea alkaliphila]|uniref:N-acetylmuramoyl-L-alanine amidase n=1 Tax=Desulfatitalea alkaliphila TaxID=2929485 RepID=A0AA41UJG2_9BACT|nr:N-acetylmuramoyl-L-alanine amidase [Desulfatitalea alkaliphila]MCJ8500502.1 N-acetylmuramoyl-L-alanine amidase [Desulfatitalea alkaliphila]
MSTHLRWIARRGAWLLGCLMLAALYQPPAHAQTAEAKFYEAERCYRDLRNAPNRQKYRDQWLNCITRYLAVYRHDPHGPWAAAGLYHAGVLYGELYKRSFVGADRQEAIDLFERVVRHFPKSRYRPRAEKASSALKGGGGTRTTAEKSSPPAAKPAAPPPAASANAASTRNARQFYEQARANDARLEQRPELKKLRDQWLRSINAYRQAYQAEPNGALAAAALFGLAQSYSGLHHWSRNEVDRLQARKTYEQLLDGYPQSPEAEMARQTLGIASRQEGSDGDAIARVIETAQDGAPAVVRPAAVAGGTGRPAVVEGLRFWSNPRYTRVVIDADQDAVFTYNELREDPAIGKPQRIYIDLHNSRLSNDLQRIIPINDDLLSDARAGQYTADTVRVVVDIKSARTFKIFSLKNPFRIVLDVWGVETGAVAQRPAPEVSPSDTGVLPPGAIVKQLALGVRRIVIDPGHGGRDPGAPGYHKGVQEKDVVLAISKKLAEQLRAQLKCEVILTRDKDVYLSLEERTAIANTQNADLFISIHANASPDRRASGFETYILNLATDDEAIRVAARENATSMKNISDLDSILKDLMQNAKVSESTLLASYVQEGALGRLGRKYNIRNKGVKKAPFYVLLGAEMPSILVETGFISNPEEGKRLTSPEYQRLLVQGIVDGIKRYINEVTPTAMREALQGPS